MTDWTFFKGKKILITGHTGFKGSWMCRLLAQAGAEITGYALKPPTVPNMYELCHVEQDICSVEGDIRDLQRLQSVFDQVKPELVVHMAAQPIVRESYQNPVYTYEVNVMGTVNVLECIRQCDTVRSFVNVTTDKVYRNKEWEWGYRENEELNGFDPYSNSKSCSELVTDSYRNSFFGGEGRNIAISTARAGNVIGGGDFAVDRIIPDMVRAAENERAVLVRNPHSVRPYQHVLEPVAAYLMILKEQYEKQELSGNYNVGPDEADCLETGKLADMFCEKWKKHYGKALSWYTLNTGSLAREPHEANYLRLDCSRLKKTFGWHPCWNAEEAVNKTAEWYAAYAAGENVRQCTDKQIEEFLKR